MVVWSQPAKADLRNIHDFIARDSKFYAKKTTQEIIEKTDILETHPFIGRVVPEVDDENIREISHLSYRIIYQLADDQLFILAIVHKRQNLKNFSK
jgi:plasmid stabilization system protein ParE